MTEENQVEDDDLDGNQEYEIDVDDNENSGEDEKLDNKTEEKTEAEKTEAKEKLSNREKRNLRKQNKNAAMARKDAENAELRARLEALEGRTVKADVKGLEVAYQNCENEILQLAEDAAVALENGDARLHTQKLMKIATLDKEKDRLRTIYQQQAQSIQKQPSIDKIAIEKASEWAKDNSDWFDNGLKNQNSKIAFAISETLAQEGYNPTSDEYYEELDNRLEKLGIIPKLEQDEVVPKRKSPPVTGKASRSDSNKVKVNLPAEYVKILKDNGLWDNPEVRNRHIKAYQKNLKEAG